jgi:hypothetical protein
MTIKTRVDEVGEKIGVLNVCIGTLLDECKWPPTLKISSRRLNRLYDYTVEALDKLEKFRRLLAYAKAEDTINRIERSK